MIASLLPCPSCGVPLAPALVAAIGAPHQPERCPHEVAPKEAPALVADIRTLDPSARLAAYMLLGSMIGGN